MTLVFELEAISGPDEGQTFTLQRKETTIGRGAEAVIRLNDTQASRLHCKLVIKGHQVEVEDLGSTNGTKLDGALIKSAALEDGHVLGMGNSELRLRMREERKEGEAGEADKLKAGVTAAVSFWQRILALGWSTQVLVILVALALLSQVLVAWPLIGRQEDEIQKEALKRASVLVLALAALNREALRLNDEMLIDVKAIGMMEGVVEAFIYDKAGRTLAPVSQLHKVPGDPRGQNALKSDKFLIQDLGGGDFDLSQPILVFEPRNGKFEKMGTARILFSMHKLESLHQGALSAALISLVLLLAAAVLAGLIIVRITAGPLKRLREDLEAALKGDQSEVRPRGMSQLLSLGQSINRTLAKMRQAEAGPPAPPPAAAPATGVTAAGGQEELAALVQTVGEGVLLVDASNNVVLTNQAFCQGLGKSEDQVKGRHILEAISDQALLASALSLVKDSADAGGQAKTSQAALADGRQVEVRVSALPAAGGEAHFIAICVRGL